MSEAVIMAKNLSKSYNGKKVLNGLNLSVKKGMVFGLLGGGETVRGKVQRSNAFWEPGKRNAAKPVY